MPEMGYFIDIERFVKWSYANDELFGKDGRTHYEFGSTTGKKWRKYQNVPSEETLELINSRFLNGEAPFDYINIAELMICANNEKDHRGAHKEKDYITSTGKKILNILLLGRILDREKKDGFFCVTQKDTDIYKYLSSFTKSNKKTDLFYYQPGRTISVDMIKDVGNTFNNKIEEAALVPGLEELARCGLVTCVDNEKQLYKLNFDGCKSFLIKKIENS